MRPLTPLPADADPLASLRDRGYAFYPSLFPEQKIHDLAARLRDLIARHQWLRDHRSFELDPGLLSEPATSHSAIYGDLQRCEALHRLAWEETLLTKVRQILGEDIFCHPTKAVRVGIPTKTYVTKPHQDFSRLRVASDVITAWVCLTDCSGQQQGLRILENSHRDGFLLPDDPDYRSAPIYLRVPIADPRWLTACYRPGDVVLFHSLTVHAGGPNPTTSLRVSADFRYQRTRDPILEEWLHPHGFPRVPDWRALTDGWTSKQWVAVPAEVPVIASDKEFLASHPLTDIVAPPSSIL